MYDRTPLRQQDPDSVWIPNNAPPPYRQGPVHQLSVPSRSPTIGFLVFLFCLFVVGYFIVKQKPAALNSREPAEGTAVAATPTALSPGEAEDLVRHLENAVGNLIKTSEEINRSQMWIGRTIPALDRNYLNTEKTRLQSATAASEAARRYIEQAREEMEIAKNLLIERRKQQ